jgi:long-chain acyl-CoA synthetase
MMPRTLIGHLFGHVKVNPLRLALGCGADAVTYAQLAQGVLRVADILREEGVSPGDRVMLEAVRRPEFVCAYFACHFVHAIAVPYASDMGLARFENFVEFLRPRAVLCSRQNTMIAKECRIIDFPALNDSSTRSLIHTFDEPDITDPADIMLTSGTTGNPKGVILSHGNILAAARNINQFIGNTAEDREALALPLSHSFGIGRMRCQILAGGSLIFTKSFQFPKEMFETMRRWKVTGFSFVPAGWTVLTRLTGEKLMEFADTLKYIEIGSAPMPKPEKERLMRLFPHTRICMHYGLTEASRSAFMEFHDFKDRLDSIGKPTPNVEIRIVDEGGCELEPGRVGRIEIRGDHVMKGYWNAEVSQRLRGGWLRSGDLGCRDQDGYIYVSGREDDAINVGGRKVYPMEIEQVLLRHEQIRDVVCVGTPNPITGEAVLAFLVAKSNCSKLPNAEALAVFLRAKIEEHKIPIAFEWIPSVPRNSSGKIDRKAVLDSWRLCTANASREG